jgi:MoaA/NifB/PqqE/SkfB family radical SAM enzyme
MSTQVDNKLERIFFPTCNVSFKKQHLKERFNELFPLPAGEDLEFFWRIFKSGNKFLYDEGIRVFHNCHPDFKSFIRQAYKYGKGNFLVQYLHQDHPLLHEIKVSGFGHFALGCAVNFLKVPRFSYLLGRRLIRSNGKFNNYEKIQIYIYFALHKLVYLTGNIAEYFRVVSDKKLSRGEESKQQKKPEFIILDITHKCNLKCNICEIRKDGQIREFAIDEVKELIRQAMQWGVKEFVFSGGEPLVRKDIFEALDFVKANKYRVGLLTNGILLQGLLPRLSYYLSSNSLSLSISLDALTAEIHDDIRGKSGSFVTTISALKKLSELKKEQPNINFNVISIVLNTNLEELLPLANYLKTLEVNSIQFQPLLANNLIMRERSERVKYWIPQERYQVLDSTIDSLIEFKRSNPFLVRNSLHNLNLVKKYFRGELTSKDVKCSHISKTMLIANNGDVTTCFDCYGNVRKDSLVDIFNSQAARHSKRRAEECRRPCLLPCFTDWQE